jgi:hypothetical protein
MISNYYEAFIVQNRADVPDGFGGVKQEWTDGDEIAGFYRQDTSGEQRRAESTGIVSSGMFVTDIGTQVRERSVIKRKRDGLFLRITSMPTKSANLAESEFMTMSAEKTEGLT